MIVPQYWAEASLKKRINGRQVTVKRFGWSDVSETEAQQHADNRAVAAMAELESGKKIRPRESKVAYNGADGIPIREEIVEQHNDCVITRNSYGALCLNTPDVLFADVDFEFEQGFSSLLFSTFITVAIITGFLFDWLNISGNVLVAVIVAAIILSVILATLLSKLLLWMAGGVEKRAKNRIYKFAKKHPDWHLRLYRTPAGYRVLVMHKTFDPTSEETWHFFTALKSDPIYMQMCKNQRCFRARISPKPWRIGVETHIKPRRAAWPINPDKMPERIKWVADYEKAAHKYASCQFEEKLGSSTVNSKAEYVRSLHDKYSNANAHWPIA